MLCSQRLKHIFLSFELHRSGVTCVWFSWPEDQSSIAYLCEHHLLSTKARAVRPDPPCSWPAAPRLTQTWTHPASTNTLLDNFKHSTQLWTSLPHMKDKDSSFLWARHFVWCNALTYMGTVQVGGLSHYITTTHLQHDTILISLAPTMM